MTDHTPPTEQQLDDIEARAGHLYEYDVRQSAEADVLAGTDVPALVAEIRRLRAQLPEAEPEAIHTHFGLTYANYLVLPRTLLQSMPDLWQTRFVALLDELHAAFAHVPQAECYEVTAGTEHIVNEMGEQQLKQAGIVADWYRGETPPEGLSHNELAEWLDAHEDPEGPSYSRNGEELDPHSRVLIPCEDPVPHYNRGRTHIAPAVSVVSSAAENGHHQ